MLDNALKANRDDTGKAPDKGSIIEEIYEEDSNKGHDSKVDRKNSSINQDLLDGL